MKTNVSIELTDEQRDAIANMIDGKVTKRLATRKDIVNLVLSYIESLNTTQKSRNTTNPVVLASTQEKQTNPDLQHKVSSDLRIDPEDRQHLAGKPANYVRGWNNVKHRSR